MAKKKSGAARKAAKKASEATSQPDETHDDVEMNGGGSSDSEVEVIDPPSSDPTTAEGWKEKGTECYKAKNYSEAIKAYSKALQVDPTLTTAQFNRAAAYMALRDYPSALQDCRQVLASQKPRQAKTLARIGKIQLALAQTQPAEYSLEEAKSLADEATLKNVQADLAKLGRLNNHLTSVARERERSSWQMVTFALDAAQREVEEVPMQWKIWRLEALIGRNKLDEASFLATDLLRASQSNPEALYWRGIVLYKQGNWDQAKNHFERSVGLDPDNAQHIKALKRIRQFESKREAGKAAFSSRNYTEAVEKYTEALDVDPENEQMQVLFRSNRALALTALKKYDEVIEDCDVILGIQSDHFKARVNPDSLRSRARARLNTQNYEGAVQDFKAALEASDSAVDRNSISSELENAEKELKISKQKDYYKELGLDRTQSYSEDEIKKAYRKQSLKNHPDKGGTEEKFKEIGEAYSVLSDPVKRRRHDAGEDLDGPSMEDMFGGGGSPFGGGGFGMGGSPFGHSHGGFESAFGGGGMGGGINLEDLLNAQMGGGGGRRQSRRPF